MPAQVATPAGYDSLASRQVGRKSILASMDAAAPAAAGDDELTSPVQPTSNTDALLRARRSSDAPSRRSLSVRSGKNGNSNGNGNGLLDANGGANGNGTSPTSSGFANGFGLRHQISNLSQRSSSGRNKDDSDNRSVSSRRSSRDVISSIMRRGSRSGSAEPENGSRSRSGSLGGSRRLSVRMPSFSKKSSTGPDSDSERGGSVPPVPSLPQDFAASRTNGKTYDAAPAIAAPGPAFTSYSSRAKAAAPVKGVSPTSSSPTKQQQAKDIPRPRSAQSQAKAQTNGTNGSAPSAQESNGSYVSSAVKAVAGAGAAAGGAAAAVASGIAGYAVGKKEDEDEQPNFDDDESEDEFHDAELADIAEHEDEHEHEHPQQGRAAGTSHEEHAHLYGRHRGLSESTVSSLRDAPGRSRFGRPELEKGGATAGAAGFTHQQQQAPSQLRGTAGAKRRSGSVPTSGGDESNTPSDLKAKKETPVDVREKAARVQRLTFDDVSLTSEDMEADIVVARRALNLFLNSRMFEAEEIMKRHSDRKLYYALGDAIIAVIKGMMTFEPEDLAKAISYCKDSLHIASMLRRPSNTVASFGRFVRGVGISPSGMASMTKVQRHAELVYAESLLLKACMGILYSGDFFAFVSEALNLRNAYGTYRSLSKYVEWADEKSSQSHDASIDEDFRSGVYLGNGLISMILGLLPGKVLKIMEVFGYTGDTVWGLQTLAKAGDWSSNSKVLEPGMPVEQEGLRRQICDMGILLYHLVISTFIPVQGVDIDFADKVLHYNLQRYPEGVFFLYFSGRLYSTEALAAKAVKQYTAAKNCQQEYVQLHHICYWDMALCHMSLAQWKEAYECFCILLKESNWSKCVYNYGRAATLLSMGGNDKEAFALMRTVPDQMQRIAGKSIPMEKYCARKAKKAIKQKGRLLLAGIEFSYIYHCLTNAPRYALFNEQLVDISDALAELSEVEDPAQYKGGADEYWDDLCLAHFLRGVTLRYIAYPEPHARVDPVKPQIPVDEACQQAELSLKTVIENGHKITLDHYLVYFSHYELGRLYASQGKTSAAREQFDLIMSGKPLEDKGRKGKYSMQNMCQLRSNGALQTLPK